MYFNLWHDKNLLAEAVHRRDTRRLNPMCSRQQHQGSSASLRQWHQKDKQHSHQSLKLMGVHVRSEAYLCHEDHLFCSIQRHLLHPSPVFFHSNEITLNSATHPDAIVHQERWKMQGRVWIVESAAGWDSVGHHCVVLIRDTAASVSQGTGWGWHFSLQVNCAAQM